MVAKLKIGRGNVWNVLVSSASDIQGKDECVLLRIDALIFWGCASESESTIWVRAIIMGFLNKEIN